MVMILVACALFPRITAGRAAEVSSVRELAERGDLSGIEAALADGADVDAMDESGERPLHAAASW